MSRKKSPNPKKLRVIFMGTPDFALPSFHAISATEEMIGVVTQPDRPKGRKRILTPSLIKTAALEKKIPIFQPERLRKAPEIIEALARLMPDLIIVVAFGQILPETVLKIPKYACVNVHASLLPKYRGAGPIQWAIIRGESETGVTTMEMDAGMDTGPILLKSQVQIEPDETTNALSPRLAKIGASLLLETLAVLKEGKLVASPQDDAQATYAPLLKKEDALVQWEDSALSIYNRWRGLFPWPGLCTFYEKERWKITSLIPGDPEKNTENPGEILGLSGKDLEVATGRGSVLIKGLQAEGRRKMSPIEYASGHPIKIGTILQKW